MAVITENFGYGGANLSPLGSGGEPTLAEALRDVADDLADINGLTVAEIVSPDATDLATVITLANEIKGAFNAAGLTVTSPDATDLATAITLVNEIKADLNAGPAVTLRTTKG